MQSVFNVGNLVRVNPKGQIRLWVVLVGLLFSSLLLGQRVNVIDQKGTKASTGVEYTESATQPANPIEGDLWKNTTDGLLYVYDGVSWKKFVDLINGIRIFDSSSGLSAANPLKIGTYSTEGNKEKSIDKTDVAVIDAPGSSGQVYIKLEKLTPSYHGKKITIVENGNENPKIVTEDFSGGLTPYYDDTAGTNDLFDLTIQYLNADADDQVDVNIGSYVRAAPLTPAKANDEILYESFDFIWYMPTSSSNGRWIPMR